MIRGKKTIRDHVRFFYENGKKIGSVKLCVGINSVVKIGKDLHMVGYTLRKQAHNYNQQYLARVMRRLFLAAYEAHQAHTFQAQIQQTRTLQAQHDRVQKIDLEWRNRYNVPITTTLTTDPFIRKELGL